MIEAVGTVQAIASIQIKSRRRQPDHEGECRGRRAGERGRHPLRARCAHAESAARPDRGADPQGPGAGRAGQARRRRATRSCSPRTPARSSTATRPRPRSRPPRPSSRPTRPPRRASLTQLTYTEIRAPVSGRIGSISSKAGTVLRVGDNSAASALATINQVDPIYVAFAVPQVFLPDIRAAMAKGDVKVVRPDRREPQAVGRHRLHREQRRSADRHGDGQGAHRQRQRGPVARPVRQGRGHPRHRARGDLGARAGHPARPAGSLPVRRQGRRCRAAPGRHQAHPERRVGDRQGPRARRAGGRRRPAPPGQRRQCHHKAGDARDRRRPPRRRRAARSPRAEDRTCFQPSASAARS